jgi:anti-sigma B factor antagonist
LRLQTKMEGNVLVVQVQEKRLDANLALPFKERVGSLIAEGNEALVLDLADVEFVDSSGLGAIVSCLKKLGRSGRLAICNARPAVLGVFKLTRMDRVFTLTDSEADAVSRVAG